MTDTTAAVPPSMPTLPSLPSLPFLPFALPEIGDDEIAEVVDALKSGWVTTGPKTRRFEQDFSAHVLDKERDAVDGGSYAGIEDE